MRRTNALLGAVAVVYLATAHSQTRPGLPPREGSTDARAAHTATTPRTASSPAAAAALARYRAFVPHGAAPAPVHPNAALPDRDLGTRVAARPLRLPPVASGQAATFTFDAGQRRGWVLQLSNQLLTTPAYARGRVYVGAGFSSRTVYALDAHTGAQQWSGSTPDGGPTAAIIDDDKVYFNTESCTLFAFDTATGRELWHRWLGDPLMSQPAADRGRVFSAYPAHGGFEFASLDAHTGAVQWTTRIAADVITAPVVVGDAVFASTMGGTVYRLRARDGHVDWSAALDATSAPAVHQNEIYLAQRAPGAQERQLVLDARNGRVLRTGEPTAAPYAQRRPDTGGTIAGWSFEGSRPVYADGRIYYAMGEQLLARDAASGRVVWQRRYPHDVAQRGVTSPTIVGSVIVVGTREGELFGLDIDTGATAWAWRVGEPIAFQPTVANGWVYATTEQGKVLGLEVADRTLDGWHMWGGNAQHDGLAPPEPAVAERALPPSGVLRVRADAAAAGAHAVTPAPGNGRGGQASADAEPRAFPLLHTSVRAEVAGVVARVSVEQTFTNPFPSPVDAEYLFPLPASAAVDAMDLRVGARTIRGEIHERGEARTIYQTAHARGQTAALLEQERPNLFRQAVANVRPGETVRVTLRFAQPVPYHDGTYELALPLATGSRFTPGAGATPAPPRPPGTVDISARIDLGLPLAEVTSPSHTLAVAPASAGTTAARVDLAAGAVVPDRDFVLRYRPRVTEVEPALLATRAGEGDAQGFFTLALHADPQAPPAQIAPRELVFLVDTSSSMRGAPLAQAQALLRRVLARMRPEDRFRLVRFSDVVSELSPSELAASPENVARARAFVDGLQAAGSTDMVPALRTALAAARPGGPLRMVVLVTDGYIGNERDVLAAVRARTNTDARVFAFGVGNAVNRYLLEQVAEEGRGHAEVVLPSEDAAAAADRFAAHVDRPYLTDVAIDWGTLDVGDVYPREIPDLFADRPLLVSGRYHRGGAGDVRISARLAGRPWTRTLRVTLPERAADHEALPSLWARARVHELSRAMLLGEAPALRDEVTQLGLAFGLVTDYTSFVAVDETPPPAPSAASPSPSRSHLPAAAHAVAAPDTATNELARDGTIVTATEAPMTAPAAAPVAQTATPMPTPTGTPTVTAGTVTRSPMPAAGGSSIDDLMRRATSGGSSASAPHDEAVPPPTPAFPSRPSRAQVSETMSPLASAVRACAQGATGTVTVALVVRSTGEVQSAQVSGPFGPTVIACIQGVVRRVRFPRFSNPTVPVVYPFVIAPVRPGG